MTTGAERRTVSVVIPVWNAWEHTRACLDALRPTLAPSDEVVVIDNASRDATAEQLRRYEWVRLVTNPVNQGFAVACNQGAAAARGDVLVFLHSDAVVGEGWRDELVRPLEDPTVGAAGPRAGDESATASSTRSRGDRRGVTRGLAGGWEGGSPDEAIPIDQLDGCCLALRTEAFRGCGGFDEGYVAGALADDDLCRRLRRDGYRLHALDGLPVRHVGGASVAAWGGSWPALVEENRLRLRRLWDGDDGVPPCLVSACLIVRDEEDMLGAALDSVADLVDEIVVYDTGSIDRSVTIARQRGARVFQGYWDDSFARARNVAMAQARGTWILSLDADEELLANPSAVRTLLGDRRSDVEAYLVAIENLHGAGNARSVHTAVRLFRRDAATWRHRLHEQVVAADDPARRLRIGYASGVRLLHHGYAADVFGTRGKAQRNLLLARAALDDDDLSHAYALMNYGRALESAGHSDDAVEALREAASASGDPITRRLALRNLINILTRRGRFDEALSCVDELRGSSVLQIAADIAEGTTRIAMGDADAGLAILARVPSRGRDDDGVEYATHMLAALRGEALASLGRWSEAADVVLEAIRRDGVLEADVGDLVGWLARAGRSASEVAEALDAADLVAVLGRLLRQPPDLADAVLEGVWERFPERLEPLAAAGRLGPRLSVPRALVWSARLRARALASACPLVAMSANRELDPVVRVLAGAAAYGSFADARVVAGVHDARGRLEPAARAVVDEQVRRLAPGLLERRDESPVVAEAPTPREATPLAAVRSSRRPRGRPRETPAVSDRPRRGGVNIVGDFTGSSDEAHAARMLATALTGYGLSVSTTSYCATSERGPWEWSHRDGGDYPFETTLLVLSPEDLANFAMDVGVAPFEGRYMIGVWPWDYDVPSPMMATAARMLHEVWAPSRFAARAVGRASVGRVSSVALPALAATRRRALDDARCTFVASVDFQTGVERQNPDGVLAAYCEAFRPHAGHNLVIETLHAARYPAEHARLIEAAARRPDVEVREVGDGRRLRILDESGDQRLCVVSLHRSEGTGRLLSRAMMSGAATIATRHSYAEEVHDEGSCLFVPCAVVPIPGAERQCVPGGQWAEPDLDGAARAMRTMAAQPARGEALATRARARARRLLAPSVVARDVRARARAIEDRRRTSASR